MTVFSDSLLSLRRVYKGGEARGNEYFDCSVFLLLSLTESPYTGLAGLESSSRETPMQENGK